MALHAPEWINLSLAVISAVYAYATFKILGANKAIVDEMRNQQEAIVRPYVLVSVFLRTGTPLFHLRIKNVGKTVASDLTLSIDKDFYPLGEKREERNLAKHTAFTNPIDGLPPDGELLFMLASGIDLYTDSSKEVTPLVFAITAKYSIGSKVVVEKTIIDLRPYVGTVMPQDDIVSELKELKKSIDKLAKK